MSRNCHPGTLRGKRGRSVIGDIHGPYVVDRAVGENPAKSVYFVLKCRSGCGYERQVTRSGLAVHNKTKGCGGCGAKVAE